MTNWHLDGFCRAGLHDDCTNTYCNCPCHDPADDDQRDDR